MEAHVLKHTQIATATHEVVAMKSRKSRLKYMETYVLKHIQIATATHEVVPMKQ